MTDLNFRSSYRPIIGRYPSLFSRKNALVKFVIFNCFFKEMISINVLFYVSDATIMVPYLEYPTNTPSGFHVETTWKRPFPRRFNVEPHGVFLG